MRLVSYWIWEEMGELPAFAGTGLVVPAKAGTYGHTWDRPGLDPGVAGGTTGFRPTPE
jgi:hypothetical protein